MTVKDRIFMQGLQFYGHHGVLPEERELGQRFTVDLEMAIDLAEAGRTDNLDDTVNYVYIYDLVKEIVTGRPYKLIESVAEAIADRLMQKFPTEGVTVTVKKLHPPIPGILDCVAVRVVRGKD